MLKEVLAASQCHHSKKMDQSHAEKRGGTHNENNDNDTDGSTDKNCRVLWLKGAKWKSRDIDLDEISLQNCTKTVSDAAGDLIYQRSNVRRRGRKRKAISGSVSPHVSSDLQTAGTSTTRNSIILRNYERNLR